jgi:lipopolysaccharide transport system permease protein
MPANNVKVLRPKASRVEFGLGEIWEYRELLYFLTWKQIKTKYKQTSIGIGWAILQPLLTTIVFTIIFGRLANIPSDGIPYEPFIYSTLILWTFFSVSLTSGSLSLVANASMVSKVYFPRILLPFSLVIAGLLDYAIAGAILVGIMVFYQVPFTLWSILLFIPLALTILLSAGMSFWLSALSAKYRDVQYIVPFFVSLLLFASPIIYPWSSVFSNSFKWILMWNPLAGIMTAQRFFVFGHPPFDFGLFGISVLVTMVIFITGLVYFKHYERQLADVI